MRHLPPALCLGWLALILGLLTSSPGLSADPTSAHPVMTAWLHEAIGATRAPAMGMIVFTADELIGLAVAGERAHGSGLAVQLDDPWHLGSNGKIMTALVAARLQAQGRIEPGQSTAHALAASLELPTTDLHAAWQKVGLAELLTHCSGLPANPGFLHMLRLVGDERRDDTADRRKLARSLLQSAPGQPPGEQFEYSNLGYLLIGAILEAQTGQRWTDLMRSELFAPLSLTSAGFGPPGTAREIDAPRGHRTGLLGRLKAVPPGASADNPPALNPAGRIHMNLGDYARFLQEFLRGLDGRGQLLDRAGYRQLIQPGCAEDYARGWGLATDGSLIHAGSNTLWLALTRLWPDEGVGVVVVSNDGRDNRQYEQFEQLIAQGRSLLDAAE